MAKPFKGSIKNWCKRPCSAGLGYYISGIFVDHSQFGGCHGQTSWVVSHNEETGEIETRNSRYLLIDPVQESSNE